MRKTLYFLFLLSILLSLPSTLHAQFVDAATGAPVEPGDSANKALRINCVIGCSASGTASALDDNDVDPNQTASLGVLLSYAWNSTTSKWVRSTVTDGTYDTTVLGTGPQIMYGAVTNFSTKTKVVSGRSDRPASDGQGRAYLAGHCDEGSAVDSVTTLTNGTAVDATNLGAAGSGNIWEVWDVVIQNESATGAHIDIRKGTAGAVMASYNAGPDWGGAVHARSTPLRSAANGSIALDSSATANPVIVSLSACKVKQ